MFAPRSIFISALTPLLVLSGAKSVAAPAHEQRSSSTPSPADTSGIAALHRLDVTATLANRADDLVKLWDRDAVRIQPSGPAEVGREKIYSDDKDDERSRGTGRTVCYRPEIHGLEIAGDWASEWGYFSYRESGRPAIRGKVLRVLRREPDGSWKFSRVMVFAEPDSSAAPMRHPCP